MSLNPFAKHLHRGSARWLALALAASGLAASSERFGNMVVKNFAVPENFGPPHETRIKSLLQGAEAEPQSSSHLILIRGLKWQTFNETGETQLIVRAPSCVFDTEQQTVFSDGRLEAQSGDGRFFFEGEGFLLQQTNSTLTISNHVHTIIKNSRPAAPKVMKNFRFLFAAALPFVATAQTNLPVSPLPPMTNVGPALTVTNPPAAERAPTEIFSDTADFDLKNRIGVYRGHVRVVDPQMKMTCDTLTAQVSTNGGRPESIIAAGNVKVEGADERGRPVRVSCDKAINIYKVTATATNDTITLTGNVYVDSAMFKGTGDPIIWDRVRDTIHVENQDMQIQPEIKKTGTNVPPVKVLTN